MKREKTMGDATKNLPKEMTPELKELGDEIKERLQNNSRVDLRTAYFIGVRVKKAVDNEAIYGSEAGKQLAKYTAVPEGDRTLRNMLQLAKAYRWKFLEAEVGKPMANGRFLTQSHFLLLSRIKSKKEWADMLERIRSENLSVRDLQREIDTGAETTHKRSGGRKLKKPSTPAAGLSRLTRETKRLVKFEPGLDEFVFNALDDMPSTKLNGGVLKAIDNAVSAVANAKESLDRILGRLEKSKARANELLQAKTQKRSLEFQPA